MDELSAFLDTGRTWLVWGSTIVVEALTLAAVVSVLRKRSEPMTMFAWVLVLLFLPLVGLVFYVLLGAPRVRRRRRKHRRRAASSIQADAFRPDPVRTATRAGLDRLPPNVRELARLSSRFGAFSITTGNLVRVLANSGEVYGDLLEAIDAARRHIHLEYYIFRADETGRTFRDRLAAKAAQGVEVRVLIDGIGGWGTDRRFFRPLVLAGGRVEFFLPALLFRRKWNINYRNHRKIAVVDGQVAWTGSQNIGDEYRGVWRRVAPWRDTHLRLEGPVVDDLQTVFLDDWAFAAGETLGFSNYLAASPARGDSVVQILPSGPDSSKDLFRDYVLLAIGLATRSVRITSPYFVPAPGLVPALKNAVRRGVTVDILLPSKADSPIVLWAGRSYYDELLRAGVRIHEHSAAMLHSKILLVDDHWALVGSANMDVRSFSTNFELTATIFDQAIASQLRAGFERDCGEADSITRWPLPEHSMWREVLEGIARLFSPLL